MNNHDVSLTNAYEESGYPATAFTCARCHKFLPASNDEAKYVKPQFLTNSVVFRRHILVCEKRGDRDNIVSDSDLLEILGSNSPANSLAEARIEQSKIPELYEESRGPKTERQN